MLGVGFARESTRPRTRRSIPFTLSVVDNAILCQDSASFGACATQLAGFRKKTIELEENRNISDRFDGSLEVPTEHAVFTLKISRVGDTTYVDVSQVPKSGSTRIYAGGLIFGNASVPSGEHTFVGASIGPHSYDAIQVVFR